MTKACFKQVSVPAFGSYFVSFRGSLSFVHSNTYMAGAGQSVSSSTLGHRGYFCR
jgi:hypothetical protein